MSAAASSTIVQSAYQQWKQFDLPTLQKELDDKATELANRQDESENSRKKLVDLCKEFKRAAPEDVRKAVTPVLKSFQLEIDNLSKRSKAAEAAFLSLYKKIIDSSDPTPVLESCLQLQKKSQKVQDLEIENGNLRETLQQYNREFADVKNQEITIRELKEKIKTFEERMENMLQEKLLEKETILNRELDEQRRRFLDNEALLEKKCKETENRAHSLEQTLRAVQHELFALKSQSDDLGSARSSEMEMLANDLEKANLRAFTAEKECETLRDRLTEVNNLSPVIKLEPDQEPLSASNDVKDRQIGQLLDEVTRLKTKYDSEFEQKTAKINELNEKLTEKSRQADILKEQLNSRKDYEEIKRELNVLKCVYLGQDEESKPSGEQGREKVENSSKSLDVLLLEKNKSLQMEKTSLSSRKRELEAELSTLQSERKDLVDVNERQKMLIENLERDLMRVQSLQQCDLHSDKEVEDQSTLDLISDAVGFNRETIARQSLSPTNAQSLLPIVANQRERLRVRVEELEEINSQHQKYAASLSDQNERLKSDNVKLYEKIKFLQNYQNESNSNLKVNKSDEIMSKYSSDYEASLDPFRRFGAQERQRRYTALSTHDKATLNIGRLIVNSAPARAIFFFYLLFLHCLVFLVLYKLAYTESCQRDVDTECMEKYREHMQVAHGHSSI